MTETQEEKVKRLLLDVLYAHMGGHLDTRTEAGKQLLDAIRKFLFVDLGITA